VALYRNVLDLHGATKAAADDLARRYAMHAPEQFLDADAERVARHMGLGNGPGGRPPLRVERAG
jgi:hypothetical protein